MTKTFPFMTCLGQVELLGRQAKNARELLTGLQEVPESSIYYHTHRFIQQHIYLSPEPANDFAYWITSALGHDALGELLASIDTVKLLHLRDLRMALTTALRTALAKSNGRNGECQEGEEFHFMACRAFILPTGHEARDLGEFRALLGQVGINSIYYHIFEARLRLGNGENDFSAWFKEIGRENLARALSRLDPYTYTLEGLREKIMALVGEHDRN